MRQVALVLLLFTLGVGFGRAEEPEIPIEIESWDDAEVTPQQLAWIRGWLKARFHADDLVGVEVRIGNQVHPLVDYYAVASLKAVDGFRYRVRRVVTLWHESWPTYIRDKKLESGMTPSPIGAWAIEDGYSVRRIFTFGETRIALRLSNNMSYDDTHAVLAAIHAGRVEFASGVMTKAPPPWKELTGVRRDEGERLCVSTVDAPDSYGGWLYYGRLVEGRLVVDKRVRWIS